MYVPLLNAAKTIKFKIIISQSWAASLPLHLQIPCLSSPLVDPKLWNLENEAFTQKSLIIISICTNFLCVHSPTLPCNPWKNFACLMLGASRNHMISSDSCALIFSVIIIMQWVLLELGWGIGSVYSHGPDGNSDRVFLHLFFRW